MIDFLIESSNKLQNIKILTPNYSSDKRGYIFTSYYEKKLNKVLSKKLNFIHDKFSYSKKNVLRGLHGDPKSWKLVSCVFGEVFQVVVNYNKKSTDYLKFDTFKLTGINRKSILIPPNYLNGFYVKSQSAVYHYKLAYIGNYFDEDKQYSLKWNDKSIGINWPVKKPILSNRDK